MEWLEDIGKDLMNYTRLGKLKHRVQNRNNPNAVFIWIPKNAGTSVYKTLKRRGCLKAKKLARVKYRFDQQGLVTFGHIDYARLVEEGYISQSFNRKAFKFCFSRNPYDRAISLYEYFRPSFKGGISFLRFVRLIQEEGVPPIGLFNAHKMSTCNPQVRWVEKLSIDYCGSFENLQEDFNAILQKLNLPETELKHLNRSTRARIQEYYDLETKQRVESIYREDFEHFGYPMESDNIIGRND